MKPLIAFTKRVLTNRLAQFFAVAHLIALVFVYSWSESEKVTSFNFHHQPILYKLFWFINLPSSLLSGLIFSPFIKDFPESNSIWILGTAALVLIIFSFIQWLLIGYCISKLFKK